MKGLWRVFGTLALLGGAFSAGADETPSRDPSTEQLVAAPGTGGTHEGEGGVQLLPPPRPVPPSFEKVDAPARVPRPDPSGVSANAGALRDLQLVRAGDGEARVRLGGAERTVRAGDMLAGDRIERIEPGRIVLARAEVGGTEAVVLVTFDASKRARVLVITTRDPKPVVSPEGR